MWPRMWSVLTDIGGCQDAKESHAKEKHRVTNLYRRKRALEAGQEAAVGRQARAGRVGLLAGRCVRGRVRRTEPMGVVRGSLNGIDLQPKSPLETACRATTRAHQHVGFLD